MQRQKISFYEISWKKFSLLIWTRDLLFWKYQLFLQLTKSFMIIKISLDFSYFSTDNHQTSFHPSISKHLINPCDRICVLQQNPNQIIYWSFFASNNVFLSNYIHNRLSCPLEIHILRYFSSPPTKNFIVIRFENAKSRFTYPSSKFMHTYL